MKSAPANSRVAIVGASSLLGKELATVLEERKFPVSRLIKFEVEDEERDLPIVDLRQRSQAAVAAEDVTEAGLDFAFLATSPRSPSGQPSFLRPPRQGHCAVIDMGEGSRLEGGKSGGVLSIPFLDRKALANGAAQEARLFVSAHPAAIVISSLLLRLAARFPLKDAVVHAFGPASEIGPRAIEELQKQTVNLLSFQKIPRAIFGAQLAFNLLPRLGRGRRGDLADLENRVRHQLREYLGHRAPLPAFRLFQAPVFYSMAFSLYVEMGTPAAPEAIAQALDGEPIRLRRISQPAPSQVEATGLNNILVDGIIPDAEHPAGVWVWAAADSLRLAAVNAVEIAECLRERPRFEGKNDE